MTAASVAGTALTVATVGMISWLYAREHPVPTRGFRF